MSEATTITDSPIEKFEQSLQGMRKDCLKLKNQFKAYADKDNKIKDVVDLCDSINYGCEINLIRCNKLYYDDMGITYIEEQIKFYSDKASIININFLDLMITRARDNRSINHFASLISLLGDRAATLDIKNIELLETHMNELEQRQKCFTKDLSKIITECENFKNQSDSTPANMPSSTMLLVNQKENIEYLQQHKKEILNTIRTDINSIVELHTELLKKSAAIKSPTMSFAIQRYCSAALEWLSKMFAAFKEFLGGKPKNEIMIKFTALKKSIAENSSPPIQPVTTSPRPRSTNC